MTAIQCCTYLLSTFLFSFKLLVCSVAYKVLGLDSVARGDNVSRAQFEIVAGAIGDQNSARFPYLSRAKWPWRH